MSAQSSGSDDDSDDIAPFSAFWGTAQDGEAAEVSDEEEEPGEERWACLTRTRSSAGEMVHNARVKHGSRRFSVDGVEVQDSEAKLRFRRAVKKIAALSTLCEAPPKENSIAVLLPHLLNNLDKEDVLSAGLLHLRDFILSNADDASYAISHGGITVALRCLELFEYDEDIIAVVSKVLNRLIPHGSELEAVHMTVVPAVCHILESSSSTIAKEITGNILYKLTLDDSLCVQLCEEGASSLFHAALDESATLSLLHYSILAAANLCLSDTVEGLLSTGIMAKLVVKCFRNIAARSDGPDIRPGRRGAILTMSGNTTPELLPLEGLASPRDGLTSPRDVLGSPSMPLSPMSTYLGRPTFSAESPPLPMVLSARSGTPTPDFLLSPTNSSIETKRVTAMQLAESAVFCLQVVIENEQSKIFIGDAMGVLGDALFKFSQDRELAHLNGLLDVVITATVTSDPAVLAADIAMPISAAATAMTAKPDVEVVRKLMCVFNNIAASSQHHGAIYQAKMWRPVLDFMNTMKDPVILQLCCTFLGAISSHDAEKLVESGCPAALLSAARVLPPTSEEQDSAIFALKQLAASSEQRWNVLINHNEGTSSSIKKLLQLLHRQGSNTKVVQFTVPALFDISQVAYGRKQISANSGIKILLKATSAQLKVPSLRGRMIATVVNVLQESQAELVEQVVEIGGLPTILSIMNLCTESQLTHLTDCCIVLCQVARHSEEHRQAVLDSTENVMSLLLLTVLPIYDKSSSVQWALLTIGNLCQTEQACKDALSYNGIDRIIDVLDRTANSDAIKPAVGWVLSRLLAYDPSLKGALENEFIAVSALSAGSTNRTYLDKVQRALCAEAHELVTEKKKREDEEKKKQEEVAALEIETQQRELQKKQQCLEEQKVELEKERQVLLAEQNVQKSMTRASIATSVASAPSETGDMPLKLPPWAGMLGLEPLELSRLQDVVGTKGDAGLLMLSGDDLAGNFPNNSISKIKMGIDAERGRRGMSPRFTQIDVDLPFWLHASDITDSGKELLRGFSSLKNTRPSDPFAWDKQDFWLDTAGAKLVEAGVSSDDSMKFMRYAKRERKRLTYVTGVIDEESDEEVNHLKEENDKLKEEVKRVRESEIRSSRCLENEKEQLQKALKEEKRRSMKQTAMQEVIAERNALKETVGKLNKKIVGLQQTVDDLQEEIEYLERYENVVRGLPINVGSEGEKESALTVVRELNEERERANSAEIQCVRYAQQIKALQTEAERMQNENAHNSDNPTNLTKELYSRGRQLMLANERCSNMIERQLETEAVVSALRNENTELTKAKRELTQLKESLCEEEQDILRESRRRRDTGEGISKMEKRLLNLGDLGIRAEKENKLLTKQVVELQSTLRQVTMRAKVAEEKQKNSAEALQWYEIKFDMLKREEGALVVEHAREVERVSEEAMALRSECQALRRHSVNGRTILEKERELLMDTTNRLRCAVGEVVDGSLQTDDIKKKEIENLRTTHETRKELGGKLAKLMKENGKLKHENRELIKKTTHAECAACHVEPQSAAAAPQSPKRSIVKSKLKNAKVSSALLGDARSPSPSPSPSPSSRQCRSASPHEVLEKRFDTRPYSVLDTPYNSKQDKHLLAFHSKQKHGAKQLEELRVLLKAKAVKRAHKSHKHTSSAASDWRKIVTLIDVDPGPS